MKVEIQGSKIRSLEKKKSNTNRWTDAEHMGNQLINLFEPFN